MLREAAGLRLHKKEEGGGGGRADTHLNVKRGFFFVVVQGGGRKVRWRMERGGCGMGGEF